jgi:hypothetical protein
MANATGVVASSSVKQICTTTITSLLNQYFANTLNKEKDIVRLVMGMIQAESSFNVNAVGPALNPVTSSGAADYAYSQAIINAVNTGGTIALNNANQGVHALGLMQTMGWNHIKGASKKNGKQLIEIARPDLVSVLCINPGENLFDKFLGQANVSNQILAGLVVLEQKWKATKQVGGQFQIGSGPNTFTYPSRMQCAIQGYIGLSSTDKGNGSSTSSYVANIYYGSAFNSGNSPGGPGVQNATASSSANGPTITSASGDNQHPYGC